MKTLFQRVKARTHFSNQRLNHLLYHLMIYPHRFQSMSIRMEMIFIKLLRLKRWCLLKKLPIILKNSRRICQRYRIQLRNLFMLFQIANKNKTRKSAILKPNLRLMLKSKSLMKLLCKNHKMAVNHLNWIMAICNHLT